MYTMSLVCSLLCGVLFGNRLVAAKYCLCPSNFAACGLFADSTKDTGTNYVSVTKCLKTKVEMGFLQSCYVQKQHRFITSVRCLFMFEAFISQC